MRHEFFSLLGNFMGIFMGVLLIFGLSVEIFGPEWVDDLWDK